MTWLFVSRDSGTSACCLFFVGLLRVSELFVVGSLLLLAASSVVSSHLLSANRKEVVLALILVTR